MNAMIDMRCPKCDKHIGWCGTMANRPACSRCGHRPPQAELDDAAAKMEAIRERQRTHPGNAKAEMLRMQRIDAGLTLRQAAKLLGIYAFELSSIENNGIEPSPELAAKMAEIYDVGNEGAA